MKTQALEALSRLLDYPDERTVDASEMLYVILQGELADAAKDIAAFGEFLEQHTLASVEETYTRIFDLSPTCALEVGWHLFGEEYARGMFLVRMREKLRENGLTESRELPDHITHVLPVLAAMPPDEAERFAQACVLPAVAKMYEAIQGKDTPYASVLSCLKRVLESVWGDGECEQSEALTASSPNRQSVDLLHAFPVADVRFDCGGCGEAHPLPEFVPLQVDANLRGSAQP